MEQKEIIEGNKMIAGFHGLYCLNEYARHEDHGSCVNYADMQYHTSWDWLMPVIEKLEKLGIAFTIDPWGIEAIEYISGKEKVIFEFINDDNYPKLRQYYDTVIASIQWYNTQP